MFSPQQVPSPAGRRLCSRPAVLGTAGYARPDAMATRPPPAAVSPSGSAGDAWGGARGGALRARGHFCWRGTSRGLAGVLGDVGLMGAPDAACLARDHSGRSHSRERAETWVCAYLSIVSRGCPESVCYRRPPWVPRTLLPGWGCCNSDGPCPPGTG